MLISGCAVEVGERVALELLAAGAVGLGEARAGARVGTLAAVERHPAPAADLEDVLERRAPVDGVAVADQRDGLARLLGRRAEQAARGRHLRGHGRARGARLEHGVLRRGRDGAAAAWRSCTASGRRGRPRRSSAGSRRALSCRRQPLPRPSRPLRRVRAMLRRTALLLILAGILAGVLPGAAQAARKTVVLRSAPVAMAGFNVEFPKLWVPTPKLDGYVVGMDARLVDTKGKPVTIRDVMLHHVVFYKRVKPASQSACAGQSQEAFYGTGEEKQQLRLPSGYGYPVGKAERWKMNAMLMSHSLRSLKVRVEYTVTIETGVKLEPVIPLWVRANGCGDAVSYPVWGGGGPGRRGHAHLRLARAVRRADRRRRRSPARRREGHVPLAAGVRRAAPAGHHAALRDARRPLLHGAPDPARAGPGRHALLPVGDRHPGAPRRDAQADRPLRRRQAAHAGDVDHARLPRQARRAGDAGLRRAARGRPAARQGPAGAHRPAGRLGAAEHARRGRPHARDHDAAVAADAARQPGVGRA